jgi:hypothetical protein
VIKEMLTVALPVLTPEATLMATETEKGPLEVAQGQR